MSGAASGNKKTRWHGALIAVLAMVSAHASAQSCTVGTGGALAFGSVVALASTANQTTDSGQSFKVKCDSGVAGTLRLYSATPRVMQHNASSLPFNLSLNSGAANDDLPTAPLGAPFDITRKWHGSGRDLVREDLLTKFQIAAERPVFSGYRFDGRILNM
jgi:hypothetical protein